MTKRGPAERRDMSHDGLRAAESGLVMPRVAPFNLGLRGLEKNLGDVGRRFGAERCR
jgi:hypothetical protein